MTPTMQHKTEIITLAIITLLYVLNTCLAEIVGNIIKLDINNAPKIFIPTTTVKEHNIAIITE